MFFFEILNPFFRGQLDVPLPTYPYKKSLYSGSSPQESLENTINTMGTVGVHPFVPWFLYCKMIVFIFFAEKTCFLTHTVHVWCVYIYIVTYIWLISMVNVGIYIYTIHGSSGLSLKKNLPEVQDINPREPMYKILTLKNHWGFAQSIHLQP